MWPMLITAGLTAGASIFGANKQAKAAKGAADATARANEQAIAEQRRQFDQVRQDNELGRGLGNDAIGALRTDLGINPPGSPMSGGAPDYEAFVRGSPDMQANYEQYGRPNGMTEAQFGQWFDTNYGGQDGRDVPRGPAVEAVPRDIDRDVGPTDGPDGARPTSGRPTFDRRDVAQRPGFSRPGEMTLDTSLNAFQESPDYQFRLNEAMRGVNAYSAARFGGGMQGATLKALQDRAGNLALGEYGNWRNYVTGRFDQTQGRRDNLFREDRTRSDALYSDDLAFDYNDFINTRTFNENARRDARDFRAGRQDTRTGNLFRAVGIGQGANAANQNAGNAFASAYGQGVTNSAAARGDAMQIGAQAWSDAIGRGAGAVGGAITNIWGQPTPNPYGQARGWRG